ncbi:MAG: endonuclease/exonuclease/phosphatase family protein [Gammaproteobacteria bacterium]|nr:endonuclease/exonuclease/phosphatase family protein [Gammaproteobacteria bacterium]
MIVRLLSRLAILGVVLTTLATAAALGARLSWILELFSHFAVQYLAALAVSGAVCLALRRWRWVSLALLVAVPNVLVVMPYLPGLVHEQPAATAESVSLVALNLYYRREDAEATRAYLERQFPDLLVLSEVTPRWHEKLRELEQTYPYFAIRTRLNPWGIAVYSKYPLQEVEDLDLGDDRSSHLRVLVQLPDGLAEVYAVHLASPPSPRQARQRNTQMRRLAERIASADPALPKIVAGDFNSTPFSPFFQDLLRDARLTDGRRPFGLHATWPTWPVPLWIPIDHCLVSNDVTVTRVATGTATGSDHLPLECGFSLAR